REERVIYIYSVLLKSNDYITIQQLSDELYISRGTIERDLAEVVRWLDDGNLDYIGRMDNQVKIDEFRIELYEIENIINNITEIK
ncbi:HTH domain-containing protein, partial [Clostridioides difficile]